MTHIDLPGAHDFSTKFSYETWTPGTRIRLAKVAWDSTYRDVVWFDHQADLDAYLERTASSFQLERLTYVRPSTPSQLDVPFTDALQYNYVAVYNPAWEHNALYTEHSPRAYYYFITDVRYLAPNTTQLVVQLDVWQTFIHDVTIDRAYMERGHALMCDPKRFDGWGRDKLTIPEGLDIGNEYVVFDARNIVVQNPGDGCILVYSTIELDGDFGTVESPKMRAAMGCDYQGIPSGMSSYVLSMADYRSLRKYLADYPWVAQGISTVMAIPMTLEEVKQSFTNPSFYSVGGVQLWRLNTGRLPAKWLSLWPGFRDTLREAFKFYPHLDKFLTHPYCGVEVTTNTASPLLLKPECINSPDVDVIQLSHISLPNPRLTFFPPNYNAPKTYTKGIENQTIMLPVLGDGLDVQTGLFNFPTFPIVNNSYLSYMASNRNSIAYQHQSADWSQQKALAGNQLSYDVASAGIDLNNTMTGIGVNQANALNRNSLTALGQHTTVGVVGNVASGLMSGNPITGLAGAALGSASQIANAAITANAQNNSNNINNSAAWARNDAGNANAAFVRDSNKSLADWAAKGDYAQAIAGINARVQDAKLIPPTTSGQLGGDAANFATVGTTITVKLKVPSKQAIQVIGDFWCRYGYATNQWVVMPPTPVLMTSFTYWKLSETYIRSASCPEAYKQAIRGIYEKGVTVWNDPELIGENVRTNRPKYSWVL